MAVPHQFPAVGFSYRVITCAYTPTQISLNVLYWKCTALTLADVTLQDIVNRFDTLWHAAWKNVTSQDARWRGVSIQQVTPLTAPIWVSIANDGVGTVAGGLAPTQTSGVIAKRSGIGGRHGRGRLFVGLPSSVDVSTTGAPIVGYHTALDAIATLMVTDVVAVNGASDATMRHVLRRNNLGVINYDDVIQTVARNRFATQRRRGQFGASNVLPF